MSMRQIILGTSMGMIAAVAMAAPPAPPASPSTAQAAAQAVDANYANMIRDAIQRITPEHIPALTQAAERGDISAQMILAEVYLRGTATIPQDYTQAAKWLMQLAPINSDAAVSIGMMARDGIGIPQDCDSATMWIGHAIDMGSPRAIYELGRMRILGTCVPQDIEAGVQLLARAAKMGSPEALDALRATGLDKKLLGAKK